MTSITDMCVMDKFTWRKNTSKYFKKTRTMDCANPIEYFLTENHAGNVHIYVTYYTFLHKNPLEILKFNL